MGQEALLHPEDEHDAPLGALGPVHRRQEQALGRLRARRDVLAQLQVGQPGPQPSVPVRVRLPGEGEQGRQARLTLGRVRLPGEPGAVPAALEGGGEQVRRGAVPATGVQAFDEREQRPRRGVAPGPSGAASAGRSGRATAPAVARRAAATRARRRGGTFTTRASAARSCGLWARRR